MIESPFFNPLIDPVNVTLLQSLPAVLTLLSVAFYVAEWVRHMNATD